MTYTYNNIPVTLTQQAYIASESEYRASGVDQEGNDYRVTWSIVDANCEDESEACDWSKYEIVKL